MPQTAYSGKCSGSARSMRLSFFRIDFYRQAMWRRQHRRGVSNPAIELRERISKQIPSNIEEMLLWMISARRQYTRWGCRRENKKDCTSGICHRRDADRQRTGEDDGLHGCIKKRIRKRTCFSAVFQGCGRYACSKGSSAI